MAEFQYAAAQANEGEFQLYGGLANNVPNGVEMACFYSPNEACGLLHEAPVASLDIGDGSAMSNSRWNPHQCEECLLSERRGSA